MVFSDNFVNSLKTVNDKKADTTMKQETLTNTSGFVLLLPTIIVTMMMWYIT